MPEIGSEGLDVTAEELRYLRRVFRRFAAPYLLATLALAALAIGWSVVGPGAAGEPTRAELETLGAEAASLRDALAALREGLQQQGAATQTRLDALEGGLSRLETDAGGEPADELAGRLDHAHQRITALEHRLKQLESLASAPRPAAPPAAVAPVAPAPRGEAATWPPDGGSAP